MTLDWRAIRVPPDAPSGSAVLRVNGWAILARYQIEALPLIAAAPAFDTAVGAAFPGVGELVGYSLSDPPFSRERSAPAYADLAGGRGDAVGQLYRLRSVDQRAGAGDRAG